MREPLLWHDLRKLIPNSGIPEAPCWHSFDAALAWQAGYEAGYEARLFVAAIEAIRLLKTSMDAHLPPVNVVMASWDNREVW